MKRLSVVVLLLLWAAFASRPGAALAQTITPPSPTAAATAAPTGQVTGKIIDQNSGAPVTASQEVMLHIWDDQNNDINMLHAQSSADGTFSFSGVDFQPKHVYGAMAVFDGVTYISPVVPPKEGSDQLVLDVPVYETTPDVSAVQIKQMHVLFDFAPDGLQTTEIFALSNTGIRTVKDAVKLDDGKTATMRYPLPKDADYIFFQPDTADRFVKFTGGFADTSPLLPGGEGDRFAVQYMVPYTGEGSFEYTAPASIQAMNFLLPQNSGVQLKGDGLTGPEPVTLEAGKSYEVYSLTELRAGQTVRVSLTGKPSMADSQSAAATTTNPTLPIALGGGLLGLAMVGAGFWWWRNPSGGAKDDVDGTAAHAAEDVEVIDASAGEDTLDALIARIAQLDHKHEQGDIENEPYRQERARLRDEAKRMLDHQQPDQSVPRPHDGHA